MSTTVWLIDDCPLAVKLTLAQLAGLHVDVATFSSGDAAIEAWRADEIDRPLIVIVDLHMPGMDGRATARALRDNGYLGVLVLHTTQPDDLPSAEFEAAGFDSAVAKPASKDDLRRAIAVAMQAHGRRAGPGAPSPHPSVQQSPPHKAAP